MANPTQNGVLKKDDNGYPVMGGTSSDDDATVVNSSFDPTTRRLLVSPGVSNGTGAPATTPGAIGQFYIDTQNSKLYFSVGTSTSNDWVIAN